MNILITGADGFVGRELGLYLYNNTNNNLFALIRNSNFKYNYIYSKVHEHNFLKINNWKKILNNIDIVIHLISKQHNKQFKSKIEVNLYHNATKNFFLSCKELSIKKIIYVSSLKVMGEYNYNNRPFKIEDKPTPNDLYAISKLKVEKMIKTTFENSNTKYSIIRSPLVYGSNNKGLLKYLDIIIRYRIPIPTKRLKSKKSVISLINLVDFIKFIVSNDYFDNKTTFVGDSEDYNIEDLVKIISLYKNQKSPLQFSLNFFLNSKIFKFFNKKLYYKFNKSFQFERDSFYKNSQWKILKRNDL